MFFLDINFHFFTAPPRKYKSIKKENMAEIKYIGHSTFWTTWIFCTQSGSTYGKGKDNAELKTYYMNVNYFASTNGNEIYYNFSSHGKDSISVVHKKITYIM